MNESLYQGGGQNEPTPEHLYTFGNRGPLDPIDSIIDFSRDLGSDSSLLAEIGSIEPNYQSRALTTASESNLLPVLTSVLNNPTPPDRTGAATFSGIESSSSYSGPVKSKLELLLLKCSDGKIIKRSFKLNKGYLNDTVRKLLVHVIIQHELDQALAHLSDDGTEKLADFTIPTSTFITYAEEITKLFPTEDTATYFNPFKSVNGIRILAHGKLYDHFNYVKGILREQGVLESRRPKQNQVDNPIELSGDTKSQLEWLKNNSEPWEKLLDTWRSTHETRKQILVSGKKTIFEYFADFLALRLQVGSKLLECDFNQLWPNKESLFFDTWNAVKSHLIFKLKAAKNIRNHEDKAYVHLLLSLPPDQQDSVIFFLLPYLIGSDRLRTNKRKRNSIDVASKENVADKVEEIRRLSIAERRESFTLTVPTAADLNTALDKRREELRTRGTRLQPTPVIVGSVTDVQAAYVIVDNIIYVTDSYLHAIDLTFKIFFAVNCEYPEHARSLWLFIQKAIYNIDPPTQKYPVAVNALAGELKQIVAQNSSRNS